jgi:hypothetical protein
VVGDADDIARLGGVGNLAVLREEQDRRMDRNRLAQPEGVSFMPRLNVPETSRMKAIRSRCCGSILACTLKMKPVTSLVRRAGSCP